MIDDDKPTDVLADLGNPTAAGDRTFFGASPDQCAERARLASSSMGDKSGEYGEALIILGNSYCIAGANEFHHALLAYEQALQIFEGLEKSGLRSADAHQRIASVLRRLAQHHSAVGHIQQAIDIFARQEDIDPHFLARLHDELSELQTFCLNQEKAKFPGGPPS